MALYFKERADICPGQLEDEIQDESAITAEITHIRVEDNIDIELLFDRTLSPEEEATVDSLITNHFCEELAGGNTGDISEALPMVQIRSAAQHGIGTTFEELTFDVVDVKTDSSVLSDTSTIDRISILVSGHYSLTVNTYVLADFASVEMDIFDNNSNTTLTGTTTEAIHAEPLPWPVYGYGTPEFQNNLSIHVVAYLDAGMELSVRLKKKRPDGEYPRIPASTYPTGSAATVNSNAVFSIVKQVGIKGDVGEPGPKGDGTSLTVQKADATKATEVEVLNFEGDCTVVDEGNKTTVTVTGGSIGGLTSAQINGADRTLSEPMLFMVDPTRNDYILSVDSTHLMYAENNLTNNDWCQIGTASDTDTGYIMPFAGTIVRATGNCENAGNSNMDIDVYVNSYKAEDGILNFGGSGHQTDISSYLCIDFYAGDRLRVRASKLSGNNTIQDTNISLWVKWRST